MPDSISVDDVYSQQGGAAPPAAPGSDAQPGAPTGGTRFTVHPRPLTPQPLEKSVAAEDIYKNAGTIEEQQAADKPKEPSVDDGLSRAYIDMQNKRMAAGQFTSPYVNEYSKENDLGPANQDDSDAVYYKDKDGNSQITNTNQHVVLRNPDDGQFHVYKRSEDTDYGPIYGRLVGIANMFSSGMASTTPVTGGTTLTAAQRALQAQRAVSETTGVTVPVSRAAVNPGLMTRALSHVPGVNTTFEQAAQNTAKGVDQAATATAQGVGNATTPAEAGAAVRSGLTSYTAPAREGGVLAQKVSNAYDQVDNLVDQTAKQPLTNTLHVAQDLNTERIASERPDEYGPALKEVLGAVTNPQGLTYSALKSLRSTIGEMMASTASDASKTDLKRLYKGMSDDMRELITSHGGDRATQLWDRANTMNVAAVARREQLAKVLGTNNRSNEATYAAIMRMAGTNSTADASTLLAARKSMPPEEWNELVSGALSRLGRVGEGDTGSFDPARWSRDYAKLSEQGKAVMFGENTSLRRSLDSINQMATEWPTISKMGRDPGEVAHVALVAGALESARENPFKLFSAMVGAKVMAKILSRPATAANVAKAFQSYKLMSLTPTKANLVVLNNAINALSQDAAAEDRKNMGEAAHTAYDYFKKATALLPWAPKDQ